MQLYFLSRENKTHSHSEVVSCVFSVGCSMSPLLPLFIIVNLASLERIPLKNILCKDISPDISLAIQAFPTISTATPVKLNFSLFTYCPLPSYFCSHCPFPWRSFPQWVPGEILYILKSPLEMPTSGWRFPWYCWNLKCLHPLEFHRLLPTS